MDHEEAERKVRDFMKGIFGKICAALLLLVFVGGIGLFAFWLFFVDDVDNYQIAYKYDRRPGRGRIEILKNEDGTYRRGWIVTWPVVVKVHTIDARPMQVCMNANQRVLNCKLVQFNPSGIELFLSWHGRGNYEGPGNSSTTTTTTFSEILRSYAYDGSGKTYPFLDVRKELKQEEVAGIGGM